jgi:hypothetical protein
MPAKVRPFAASVEYRDVNGRVVEETFPVRVSDHAAASQLALAYVLEVLKYREFELRVVGA